MAGIFDTGIFDAGIFDTQPTSATITGTLAATEARDGVMPVSVFRPYDHDTEELVSCSPYIEDGQVFTVAIIPKTIQIVENAIIDVDFASSVDGAF